MHAGVRWGAALRAAWGVAWALSACSSWAAAPKVVSLSPQGEVGVVRQVVVRFDSDAVKAGDPRAPSPFTLQCNGSTPAGDSNWEDARRWTYDLRDALPAGQQCVLKPAAGFGSEEYRFSTGAPVVLSTQPYGAQRIDEDQHFLLQLNGAPDLDSVRRQVWCEAEGLGERIPVRLLDGTARDEALKHFKREYGFKGDPANVVVLACQRQFTPDTTVRVVWGAGVAAAGNPKLVSRNAQRYQWKVRQRFLAEFSCEREQARGPCLPLRPMTLRLNTPVPRAVALAVRLQPVSPDGKADALKPREDPDDRSAAVSEIRFAAPLPESTRFRIVLPAGFKDETGRALSNAATFPLEVGTGGMPPLAKFAGAPFGIVEAGSPSEPGMLPVALRHVQADLKNASTGGKVAVKRLDAGTSDAELLRWHLALKKGHENEYETRKLPMLASVPGVQRADLPQLKDTQPRATEVIGIPLPQRGYHVVEVESRILGEALLAAKAPMYARTGTLVTNLGVHFKRGRSSSLVWVTTLDRAKPVAGAQVAINDCRGLVLWNGTTDAQGIARVDRGFEDPSDSACPNTDGLFVTARSSGDLSFVFSRWNRGIEPWRFNISSAQGTHSDRRAHTVFDRTLLRVGETVSMKHFLREETERGLTLPSADNLPDEVFIQHYASDTTVRLPLSWPKQGHTGARAAAGSAESRWVIPRNAPLGRWEVTLRKGDKRYDGGSLRVEAFRVPLVDARLSGPSGVIAAPSELTFNAQLNALAGGPMPAAPVKLSAILRPAYVQFPGYDDFTFEAAGRARSNDEEGGDAGSDRTQLVADKLSAITDRQGAAKLQITKLPVLAAPSDLTAELTFNDPNGEVQTVTQRLRLWPAQVVAGLRVASWASMRNQLNFTTVVLDTAGKPLKGRAVEVTGKLNQTFTTRKRIVGGFYTYDNRSEQKELGVLCSGSTDAQGRLACSKPLDVSGEVELRATVKDDAGRASTTVGSAWMTKDEPWWFAQDNDDRIDLLPEKREVEPGQTARLQLRMPFQQATALVSVEREGVMDTRIVTLNGREPVIEVTIPKAAEGSARSWAPNVIVSALVLRGRLREAPWWSFFTWGWKTPTDWWQAFRYEGKDYKAPTAMVDLAKPAFKLGAAELRVGLAEHRLDVKVQPAQQKYAVRETVRTTVTVQHNGKPAAGAEVAFAAVDEGLLALQGNRSWQLLEAMMQPHPWGVDTATAQGEIIGRRHYGRKALPPGGGGGRNPTRELFDTLLLWKGSVKLDAQGQAVIDVPLNDSLTSFRLVAIADAGADLFGTGQASVRVTQDLQMLSGLPPLARAGDKLDAGFTLRNTTDRAMSVKATLQGKAEGGVLAAQPAPQSVQLAAGAAVDVRWSVTLPEGATRVEWEGSAEEQGGASSKNTPARDRLKVSQAVLPAVPVRVMQATLQPLDGTFTMAMAPAADALPGSARVDVALQPRLSGALPGLRKWFEAYPYSCLEQKTSRALALHDATLWNQLKDEAPGYLDSDGLASYYPPSAGSTATGSDRLTAYLITAAHEAGQAWPDGVREPLLQGLAAFVEGRLERRFWSPRADLDMRKLAALDALARHSRVQPRMLGSISWAPASWPTSALLDAWSLYRRVDNLPERAARLDELQRLVRSRLISGGTTLKFSTEESDDWWWLMDGPDANAARLLLAASELPAWKDDVASIVNGTLARQKRGAWLTTTANLWGVLALERFAANFEKAPVTGRSTLQLAGTTRNVDWAAKPAGEVVSLPLPSASQFTAKQEGTGKPWLTVQSLAAVPLKAPLFAGYRISKTVTAVERKQPNAWTRGDIVRVRLEVDAVGDMSWVVVADPIPTGATLLGGEGGLGRDSAIATQGEKKEGRDSRSWPAYEERTFDSWRGYFNHMPRGKQVLEYTLRLNSSGQFKLPPTRVEAMYAPETFGELPNAEWTVLP